MIKRVASAGLFVPLKLPDQYKKGGAYFAVLGTEQLKSPAHNLTTLFLTGLFSNEDISEFIEQCQTFLYTKEDTVPFLKHLCFGVDGSYDGKNTLKWKAVINHFLKEGFWCSLEVEQAYSPLIQKSGLCKHAKFIPIVNLKMSAVRNLGHNAVLRLNNGHQIKERDSWCYPTKGILGDPLLIEALKEEGND